MWLQQAAPYLRHHHRRPLHLNEQKYDLYVSKSFNKSIWWSHYFIETNIPSSSSSSGVEQRRRVEKSQYVGIVIILQQCISKHKSDSNNFSNANIPSSSSGWLSSSSSSSSSLTSLPDRCFKALHSENRWKSRDKTSCCKYHMVYLLLTCHPYLVQSQHRHHHLTPPPSQDLFSI